MELSIMHMVKFLVALALPCVGLASSSWQPLASIPIAPRQEHTTAFLPPDTIAIIGGIVPIVNSTSAKTTDLVQFYSIKANTWKSVAPIPIPLNHPNAAVVNGVLFVFGGLAETDEAWGAVSDCWSYDEEENAWRDIAALPDARGSAATGVWDGKVILAGGLKQIRTVSPFDQATVDTVSIYDTEDNSWITVPSIAKALPDTRDHAVGAVINRRFYVVGGRERGQLKGKDLVPVLDLNRLDAGWSISSANMPTGRAGLAGGVIGKRIYTFGGEGNREVDSFVFNNTEVFDTERNEWEVLEPMDLPRHGTAGVGVNGKIYIPGGGNVISVAPVSYFDVYVP